MSLRFKKFDDCKNLTYGFLDKHHGRIKLKNRVVLGQTHQDKIITIGRHNRKKFFTGFDGSITNQKGLTLTVSVADCFPVYFYDAEKQVVGLLHSGWQGTVKNIAGKTVGQLKKTFDTSTKNLLVGIGPGIRACHFEIKKDILRYFLEYPQAIKKIGGKIFADLPKIINSQLKDAGVKAANIKDAKECTFCERKKYFSFRRDQPKKPKTMLAYIGLI